MSSYYNNKDILDLFPLNYEELDDDEKVRVIQEVAIMADVSVDKVIEIIND
jgi:hypothetical protein